MERKASNEDRRIKIGNMSALKKCAKYALSSMWGVQELLARDVLMFAWFWAQLPFRTKRVDISRYAEGKMQPQLRS